MVRSALERGLSKGSAGRDTGHGRKKRRARFLSFLAVGVLAAGVASARVDCYGPGWVIGPDFCWSCRNICVITNEDGSYGGIVCGGYRPC